MTFLTLQYYIWIIHDVGCILCVDICRYFSIGHYRHFSPGHQGSSRESWSLPASRHTVPLQKISIFAMLCQIRILYHFIVCQAFLFVKRFSLESELDQGNEEVVQLLDNSLSTNDVLIWCLLSE